MQTETAAVRSFSIAVLVCVIASCSGTDGPGGGPAFTNSIVFVSDRSGEQQLYTMRSDGSHVQQLTTVAGNKDTPVFSPDGRHIAFAMGDTATHGFPMSIYVIDADGTGLAQLTSGFEKDFAPTWSSDGAQIAFSSSRVHKLYFGVYVMNADGSNVHALVADTADNHSPSWSPSSNEILFTRGPFNPAVYELTAGSDSMTLIVSGAKPEWSPSGSQFLFDCGFDVCISRTRDATVVDTIGIEFSPFGLSNQPKWSPDERRYAYVKSTGGIGHEEIWTASTTDGTAAVQLTPDSDGRNWAPDWTRH